MICTRCSGTGFLNLEHVDADVIEQFEATGNHQLILDWIDEREAAMIRVGGSCYCSAYPQAVPCRYCELYHDVSVCDCCGDSEEWYGVPGEHDLNQKDVPFPECY